LSGPWGLLAEWYAQAEQSEPRVPDAMQLATVDGQGRPSIRTVLMKDFGPAGIVFFTNYESRKGVELGISGHVALVLHWKTGERQVIVEGVAVRAAAAVSDAYHRSRPRGSQLGAWASDQSRDLDAPGTLRDRLAEVTARFEGVDVPRPPHWGGYVVTPTRFEFWQGRQDRLHERRVFESEDDDWAESLLFP